MSSPAVNIHARLAFLYREVAEAHAQLAKCGPDMWIDQRTSPLGRRRHIAAIKSGALRGKQVGERWLARASDIEAFVLASGPTERPDPEPPTDDPDEQLLRQLGARKKA